MSKKTDDEARRCCADDDDRCNIQNRSTFKQRFEQVKRRSEDSIPYTDIEHLKTAKANSSHHERFGDYQRFITTSGLQEEKRIDCMQKIPRRDCSITNIVKADKTADQQDVAPILGNSVDLRQRPVSPTTIPLSTWRLFVQSMVVPFVSCLALKRKPANTVPFLRAREKISLTPR